MSRSITLSVSFLITATLVACSVPTLPGKETPLPAADTPIPITLSAPAETRPVVWTSTPQPLNPTPTAQPQPSQLPATSIASETAVLSSPTPVCDRASPGNPLDISVPDDTALQPGQSFSKTWRLINNGACTWTQDYAVVWFSGQKFNAVTHTRLSNSVNPNHGIEITIDMTAPDKPGTYQSNWKLSNASGALFGIGPNGDSPFWVRIVVTEPEGPVETPTSAPAPTQVVLSNGLANLFLNDTLDLDTNLTNQPAGADVVFRKTDQGAYELATENNARIGIFGAGIPRLTDCTAAGTGSDPVALDSLASGTYLCYRTDQGLPGWARVVFLNTLNQTLSLEVLTWSIP